MLVFCIAKYSTTSLRRNSNIVMTVFICTPAWGSKKSNQQRGQSSTANIFNCLDQVKPCNIAEGFSSSSSEQTLQTNTPFSHISTQSPIKEAVKQQINQVDQFSGTMRVQEVILPSSSRPNRRC